LATIALNLEAVFSALNTHYPERANAKLSAFSKIGLFVDQAVAVRQSQMSRGRFLADYTQAHKTQLPITPLAINNAKRLLRNGRATVFDDKTLAITFSLVAAALKSHTGLDLRPTQLLAARAMLNGRLVEMATGEGKTYAAALAAATAALAGIPVHVMTSNEYLAKRDAQNLEPIYALLNLTCTSIGGDMERDARRTAYQNDIVYCTATEVIFDYLRDRTESAEISPQKNRLQQRLSHVTNRNVNDAPVLRGLCFALIDEADSILIDEASTPFILAAANKKAKGNYEFSTALEIAKKLELNVDFTVHHKTIQLSDIGKIAIKLACESLPGLWSQNSRYREELVSLGLAATHCFKKDIDYVVKENDVHIVDANTGRIAEGRQWSRGLHQLMQAKEGVEQSDGQKTLIQLTYQRFFPRYLMLSGMSGTLTESEQELRRQYHLTIEKIAPFKTNQRVDKPALIFLDLQARDQHLIKEIGAAHAKEQPILIGTDSVKESNRISQLLTKERLLHSLLNATEHEKEAAIIEKAGELGSITVATNMAGRGTDIPLPTLSATKGGLLVISCQANASRRIDRQLSGRSGRRGDPGCTLTLLSVQNGLLAQKVPKLVWKAISLKSPKDSAVPPWLGEFILRTCQSLHERKAAKSRLEMMKSDEAIEKRLSFGGRKD
jgi:preprotein translocase subunit SecA